MTDLNETLKNLKILYLKKLENDLPELNSFLICDIDYDKAMEIRAIIHKISGTGGMYGLKKLSEQCCSFEIELNKIRDNANLLNENIVKTDLGDTIKLIEDTIKEENCQTS